jgi:hypothetical protein
LEISWPQSASGFSLYTSSDLITGTWQNVAAIPVINGDRFQVTLPATASRNFFRLQK